MDRGKILIHPENLNKSVRSLSNFGFNFNNKTCVIVGSSPNILGKGYGADIDKHDIIVRCNFALIKGFEKDVGSKITHRFISRSTFSGSRNPKDFTSYDPDFLQKVFNEHFIIGTGGDTHMPWIQKHIEEKYLETKNKIDFLTGDFQNHISNSIRGFEPSAGFAVMMVMICFFDNISIYGFSHLNGIAGNWGSHYYEEVRARTGICHNFAGEKEIFETLGGQGVLKIHE